MLHTRADRSGRTENQWLSHQPMASAPQPPCEALATMRSGAIPFKFDMGNLLA